MKFLILTLCMLVLLGFSGKKLSGDFRMENPRVMIPVQGTTTTAGYMSILNPTDKPVRLKIKSAEHFEFVEMHETYKEEDRMSMRMIDEIEIKPQSKFTLKPGGHHLMLMKAKKKFSEGEKIKVTFVKNDTDEIIVEIPFKKRQ